MAGFIKRDVERVETTALNQKINKEIFDKFKDCCKEAGYPMNVVLETFMVQYADNRFDIQANEIQKWKRKDSEVDTLNTTFSKEIYLKFKKRCKDNGFFVKYVVTAFMDKYSSKKLRMEYVDIESIDVQEV